MKAVFKISMWLVLALTSYFPKVQAQVSGVEPGNKAPEIALPTPKGDTITLSSQKGKVVLIDFWATWCAPCVEEQGELARLYAKYHLKKFKNGTHFEIFGVSLDAKKSGWEQAINSMKIPWIQVSDLKFWRSPVAKSYQIQALPFNVLVDGNGIILSTNQHGVALENELQKRLVQ